MMTLSGLRDFLKLRHNASLTEMAMHFDTSSDVVRAALDTWIGKGRVARLPAGAACSNAGSGCGCGCKADEIYEWIEPVRAAG